MKAVRSHKGKVALAVAVIGALVTWYSARERQGPGKETHEREKTVVPAPSGANRAPAATFDFYLLALSLHPAFCADGHARLPECSARAPRPLVLHGLWPERDAPGTYPHDCAAPRLDLDPALAAELEELMPGVRGDLHEHEWRKHGGCAGLEDDRYFRLALDFTRGLDSALAARLTTLAGRETSARELRGFADDYHAGLGETLVFQCRTLRAAPAAQRKRPFLIEVRQCIDNDGPGGAPGTPLNCARVARRDQGCGQSFFIAGPRLWN